MAPWLPDLPRPARTPRPLFRVLRLPFGPSSSRTYSVLISFLQVGAASSRACALCTSFLRVRRRTNNPLPSCYQVTATSFSVLFFFLLPRCHYTCSPFLPSILLDGISRDGFTYAPALWLGYRRTSQYENFGRLVIDVAVYLSSFVSCLNALLEETSRAARGFCGCLGFYRNNLSVPPFFRGTLVD